MIDAHCHLYDQAYKEDLDEVIKRSKDVGISFVVNASDSFLAIDEVEELSRKYSGFCYGAFGIHPENAMEYQEEKLLAKIESSRDALLAIGEIGLDYHYLKLPEIKELQEKAFISQIRIARDLGLPIVVHSRDASEDTFRILSKEARDMKVYLHCYSGSLEQAKEYLRAFKEIYFGIGGVVTFTNAKSLVRVVEELDISHLLLETDAPYLSPTPFRGRRNEPSYLTYVVDAIARIKGLEAAKVNEILDLNARRFFNVKD